MKCIGIDITGHACEVEDLQPGDTCCYICGTLVPREMNVPSRAIPSITEPPFKGCPDCGKTKINGKGNCSACGTLARPAVRDNFLIELSPTEAVRSNLGKKHEINDDYGLVATRQVRGQQIRWLIVCDGLSVSQNPFLASEAACKAASNTIEQMIIDGVFDPENVINQAIRAAQNAVLQVPNGTKADPDTGKRYPRAMTTITVALLANGVCSYGWAGDSRIFAVYSLNGLCGAQRLTRDDSFLNQLIDRGVPREKAAKEPTAQQMFQCLGPLEGGYTLTPHFNQISLDNVAAVVATTDGAYYAFDGDDDKPPIELAEVYASTGGVALPFVEKLFRIANDRGGHDNITAAALLCNPIQVQE